MNKFKAALADFVSGRYGMDRYNHILLAFSVALTLVGGLTNNPIISLTALTVLSYSFFRSFSRDIDKRTAENQVVLQCFRAVKKRIFLLKIRLRDFRTHRHVECPHCKVIIRTTKKRGRHRITCPKCNTEFDKRFFL